MTDKIRINGTITNISFRFTRRGKRYACVDVSSPKLCMRVTTFTKRHVDALLSARAGDRIKASGAGYHHGSVRSGTTTITAERLTVSRDPEGREAFCAPEQLDMFAA